MNLYPIKFRSILKERIWGGSLLPQMKGLQTFNSCKIGESWELSSLEGDVSIVKNGIYHGRDINNLIVEFGKSLLGEKGILSGDLFPLLIKIIDAETDLSVQVHPQDEIARKRHNCSGKTELWYIIRSKEKAGIYCGFNRLVSTTEYLDRLENNTLSEVLKFHPTKPGDLFLIPAGCIHAICGGVLLAEVQQPSDITYRIYDYNRIDQDGKPRKLHTELALPIINFNEIDQERILSDKIETSFFTVEKLTCSNRISRPIATKESFVCYVCIQGEGTLTVDQQTEPITVGELILVPACAEEVVIEKTGATELLLLECYMP